MKNPFAKKFLLTYWAVAYFFWLWFSLANHPTWTLRFSCTAILVGASALYSIKFSPKGTKWRQLGLSILALVVVGFLAAILIHVVYDVLLGPDPRRFSLASNVLMDVAFVGVNAILAFGIAWIMERVTGQSIWYRPSKND